MGPTNVALVKLLQADQQLRQAQGRLDAASHNVRVQERRVNDLQEQLTLAQSKLREQQTHSARLDLDAKAHEERIEKLRQQQQSARNNKEYQAFLVEINTEKTDRTKVEEEELKALEAVEQLTGQVKTLADSLGVEQEKLTGLKNEVGDTLVKLQADVESLRPPRQAAAAAVPAAARDAFDRLADRYEGQAMSALAKPDRRREEYACTACNMDLVTDVYNKLHSRDEMVFCPSCRRILYIPDELPPELAVHTKTRRASKDEAVSGKS